MYSFAGESALDLGALRGRLQAMDRAALVRFGQAAVFMCSVSFREGYVNLRSYLGSANGSELVFKSALPTRTGREAGPTGRRRSRRRQTRIARPRSGAAWVGVGNSSVSGVFIAFSPRR